MQTKSTPAGIRVRHSRSCPSRSDGECTAGRRGGCAPTFEASVWDRRENQKLRKTFATLPEARNWRIDRLAAKQRGRLARETRLTVEQAWEEWWAAATASPPTVLSRGGRPFKPSVLRGYESDMRLHVLPAVGGFRLSELRRGDIQRFLVDPMVGRRCSPSKVRNAVGSLRVLYRDAVQREQVQTNPTRDLRLPSGLGRRERVADLTEAEQLFAVIPEEDRPVWWTAFLAGLRVGELQALTWDDVDLASGRIAVRRSWDRKAGFVAPKSQKGERTVPIVAALRDVLVEHKARTGRSDAALVFGSRRGNPFTPSNLRRRAANAWRATNRERAGQELPPLAPIGFHECRHSCVTFMHEAGLSLEEIGDLVGHSSTYMSDRYRHLRDGRRAQLAEQLDRFLARADTSGRIEQLAADGGES